MMPVLFLSTNPETQNLEDCLPKFIVYLPSLSFQRIDKKHLIEHFGSLSALSNTKEKRAFTLKSPETNNPHSEILSLHDELINHEHSKKWSNEEKYYATEKEHRYEDDDDEKLLKL